uniref:Uncharacterized protein n=1 Tax=Davidia involucrata TaxID=16924 RepID=A0A5B6YYC5_DAVIN
MATGHPKQSMDEKLVSVITLAGENRGASMQLCSESAKRDGSVSVHIQREYKSNPDESLEATTDGEGSSRDSNTINDEDQATKAYVNSNIQGINNSLVFNSSVTERNPGVHLVFSRNRTEESTKSSDNRTESLETRKAEFNITPAQKLTYEPVVKRRCLRGLFMESSDSDPDNPEKPWCLGCYYSCGYKSKDKRYLLFS